MIHIENKKPAGCANTKPVVQSNTYYFNYTTPQGFRKSVSQNNRVGKHGEAMEAA